MAAAVARSSVVPACLAAARSTAAALVVGFIATACLEPLPPATPTVPDATVPVATVPVATVPVATVPADEAPDSLLAHCLAGDDSAEARARYAEVADSGRDPVRVSVAYWCLKAASRINVDADTAHGDSADDTADGGAPNDEAPPAEGEPGPPPTIDPNADAVGDYEVVAAAERSIQQQVPVDELADALAAEGYPASALNLPDAPSGVSLGPMADVTTYWDFFRAPPGYNVLVSVDSFDDPDAIPGREIEYSTCFGCPRLDLRPPGEVVSMAQEYWLPVLRDGDVVGVYGALDQERRDTGQPANNLVHRALWWSGPDTTHRVATWQPADMEALLSSLGVAVGTTEDLQSAAARLGAERARTSRR